MSRMLTRSLSLLQPAPPTACAVLDVVERADIVSERGFWAPPGATTFYACNNVAACLPGVNGSRSSCAVGYAGVVCSVCAYGFFEQFGRWEGSC
jgi:hypothetical protein